MSSLQELSASRTGDTLGPAIGASEVDDTRRNFPVNSITASKRPSARNFVEWMDVCQGWAAGLCSELWGVK